MSLFGTSGIRGVVGTAVTPQLAFRLGACVVNGKGARVVVGRDTRTSGRMLENALVSGILSAGGNALRAGVASTPATSLAAKTHGDCGVMITASHNPPEYNGFKLFGKGGGEAGKAEEERIEREICSAKAPKPVSWDAVGRDEKLFSAAREHVDLALSLVDVRLIRRKAPKVLVDCGNGAACAEMPFALREAGCKVFAVNAEQSGLFARGLEPSAENLAETSEMARALGADLSIAHDGDADRAVVLDEKGGLLGLDAQLALMVKEELARKKGAIVSTIEAGLLVRRAAEKSGGKLAATKVGSVHVAREMARLGAEFGGEPCGEYVFRGGAPVPDGIVAGLKFVECFCRHGSLREAAARLGKSHVRRAKYPAKDKAAAMKRIAPEIRRAFKGKIFAEDGIRVDFPGGWVLARASGTEPLVRITAEAESSEKLEAVFSKAEAAVKKAL
ncbi:MAG: phosphoglucosamine mutase [Candidatus ainarchaeum sp.]|nr:phosphoglucosamine mutase [Candidatus ainarchaeum sp.]